MNSRNRGVVVHLLTSGVIFAATAGIPKTAIAGKLFFSTSNALNGTVTVTDPTVNFFTPSGTGTLYIWVTDETPVTPPPAPLSSAAMAVQISKSGTSAGLSSAQLYNFNLHSTLAAAGTDLGPTAQDRWTAVSVNSVGPDFDAIVVAAVSAAGAGSPGINPFNDGHHLNPGSATNGTLDPGYDPVAHAFLHGQLDYNIVDTGTTVFSLAASSLGIVSGTTDLSSQFTYGFATITVVPEPTSFGLMLLGDLGVATVWCRQLRSRAVFSHAAGVR